MRTMDTLWTLTVELDGTIATTVHASEEAALGSLRTRYGSAFADVPDDELTQALIDNDGLVIYIGEHEAPVPAPAAPTRVRIETRTVMEGGNDIDLTELEDTAGTTLAAAGSLDALVEAALERDPGLYDWLGKYDECSDSTRTVRFLREDEE